MIEEADRLYGLPLAGFVAERAALAKRLRADGRREDAAVVAKLPKPTVAAWAANQVLRTQGSDARELFAAGDALAAASRETLREAIARHREALGRLLAAARGLLDPDGKAMSAATLEKVMQTLNAASLDPELRAEAQAGRLVREHTFSGLGLRPSADGPSSVPDRDETPPTAGKQPEPANQPEPARNSKPAKPAKPARPSRPRGPDPKRLAAAERRVAEAEAALADARRALDDLRAE